MAARSAAAQKSLMRSGASREQYGSYQYGTQPIKQQSYHDASSNSSDEFHHANDIRTLQSVSTSRQRDHMEESRYRGRSDSQSRSQASYSKGHAKVNSNGGTDVLEHVFGIYPEKKSMGSGVSVADVVANKLFKWGSKKETPSGIPTPSREVNLSRSVKHIHPSGYVGGHSQRPSSQRRDVDYNTAQRDDVQSRASIIDQNKLDELMARQKMLEDRINQLKFERDHLLDINVASQQPPVRAQPDASSSTQRQSPQPAIGSPLQPPRLRIPSRPPLETASSLSMASAVYGHQIADVTLPIQFPMPPSQNPQPAFASIQQSSVSNSLAPPRSFRAFPPSKHMSPLKMAPPVSSSVRQDPSITSVHYVSRPLPQPPIDATPPPEYEPSDLPFGTHRQPTHPYSDIKIKLVSTSDNLTTQEVYLDDSLPTHGGEKDNAIPPSPRDDVDAEDILGWFETLKFASTGPRGRGPMAPLPRPEAGENNATHSPIGDEKINLRRRQEHNAVEYYDVKLPINDTSPTDGVSDIRYMGADWKSTRKKRNADQPSLVDTCYSNDNHAEVESMDSGYAEGRHSGSIAGNRNSATTDPADMPGEGSAPYWDDANFDRYCYGSPTGDSKIGEDRNEDDEVQGDQCSKRYYNHYKAGDTINPPVFQTLRVNRSWLQSRSPYFRRQPSIIHRPSSQDILPENKHGFRSFHRLYRRR
ncbi:hypothetical protein DRE_00930 [Drechslerella stenobrocha 248]|uniref:Uncharacterized protein n=1 Tax=Drechslerella stenobrocha 248 TaxID=1043628 RepID=W7HLJ3_9PEZI|nr:hypothetical protein DRE_00930 [Drechslerella stenobrocha 248]